MITVECSLSLKLKRGRETLMRKRKIHWCQENNKMISENTKWRILLLCQFATKIANIQRRNPATHKQSFPIIRGNFGYGDVVWKSYVWAALEIGTLYTAVMLFADYDFFVILFYEFDPENVVFPPATCRLKI